MKYVYILQVTWLGNGGAGVTGRSWNNFRIPSQLFLAVHDPKHSTNRNNILQQSN
jgi:hypothetical protein